MSNDEFILKYGIKEFRDMCKYISQDLLIAKNLKLIKSYQIYNNSKKVKLTYNNKTSNCVDFAEIFMWKIGG